MVNKPVIDRAGAIGPEFMTNELDGLEWAQDIKFLAEDRVLGAAKAQQGLRPEVLAGHNFPAEPAGADDGSREQIQGRLHFPL